jgi:predicted dehydrogenase
MIAGGTRMSDDSLAVSRRDFVKVAGAAALASALGLATTAVPAPAQLVSDRKIRVGIVGGGFGAAFMWHLDPNCTVEAVSDLRPDRRRYLQEVYKCDKAYESLEKLVLDPRIEAVAVFTGAPDHVRHVVNAMNHGKHCISAVPACMSLEEAHLLKETKERTGLKYMMAETSYYRPECILARQLWQDGKFGKFLYSEVEYYHNLSVGAEREALFFYQGKPTWRYGLPPMLYPTHSNCFHVGVTGERLTRVSCLGWGDDDPILKDNPYRNPFWNMVALFATSGGQICRGNVFWRVNAGGERAQWFGNKMAMYMPGSGGQPFIVQPADQAPMTVCPNYFHLLPEPMRVPSGHGDSHSFLTHEFIASLVEGREPAVNVYEALAMTAPGIVAMESARRGGEQLGVPSFDKA